MERREAPGPSQGPARPGTPTPSKALSQSLSWVPEAWRAGWFRKPTYGGFANLQAPPGAPSLSFGREKENRETGAPGRPKTKPRDGGALADQKLNRTCMCFRETTARRSQQ